MRARNTVVMLLAGAALVSASGPAAPGNAQAAVQTSFNAHYEASSGALPTAVCPPWTLIDQSTLDPTMSAGKLRIGTAADPSELLYYTQRDSELAVPDPLVVEARLRYTGGATDSEHRTGAAIGVTTAPQVGNALFVGSDEIFVLGSDLQRAAVAQVDTDGAPHTYRLEVAQTGALAVFQDGVLVLEGRTFADPSTNGEVPRIFFGDGSRLAHATSEWELVRHNASSGSAGCAPPPALSIDDVTVGEGDSGTTAATFTVTRSSGSGASSVSFATADGTASAGADYTAVSGTLSFADGETQKTVAVTVLGDEQVESDETFVVDLSAASGATIADAQGRGTISDDDTGVPPPPGPEPSLAIDDVAVVEGNLRATHVVFTVTRSDPAGAASVDYATSDGTAMAGFDYAPTSGTLVFAPGEGAKTIGVVVQADWVPEADESFAVRLSNATGAAIGDGEGVATIWNDDPWPDGTAPTLQLPSDLTVEATSANGAAVHYEARARDDRDEGPRVVCSPASGATFPLGATRVDCTATDRSGNRSTGAFTVRVADTKAPALSTPSDVSLYSGDFVGIFVTYTVSAVDAVDPHPRVVCDPPSGSVFSVGRTTVTCRATDASGNVASTSFAVDIAGPASALEAVLATLAKAGAVVKAAVDAIRAVVKRIGTGVVTAVRSFLVTAVQVIRAAAQVVGRKLAAQLRSAAAGLERVMGQMFANVGAKLARLSALVRAGLGAAGAAIGARLDTIAAHVIAGRTVLARKALDSLIAIVQTIPLASDLRTQLLADLTLLRQTYA